VPHALPTAPSSSKSLDYNAWDIELGNDIDREFILNGVKNGFHIVDPSNPPKQARTNNYRSATNIDCKSLADKQIRQEVQEGRYIIVDKAPSLISALGAIKKPNSDSVRLIHDCSQPIGRSVNDYAPLGEKVCYQSLEDAVNLLTPGGYSAKVDLKSAYRSVRIHPDDWAYTGLAWQFEGQKNESYLVDTRLPFGSSLAPGIFHRLTQAVRRMMAKQGFTIVAYLDDFFVHETNFERCLLAVHTLVNLLRRLGFAIS
jgi:hypothetical protein